MNREIKFRAWDKSIDRMVFENDFLIISGMRCLILSPHYEESLYSESSDKSRFDIMQFTNIKDKKQKNIYEFDIVLMNNGHFGTVKFCHQRVGFYIDYQIPPFRASYSQDFNVTYGDGVNYIDSTIEVVGNIYENKNLLS